jgi:hypothetical protein
MQEFELYTDYKIKNWNLNMKVSMFVLCFILVFFLIRDYLDSYLLHYFSLTLLGLFILSQLVELKSFFSKYEHEKGEKGSLKFSETEIMWNGNEIRWNEIIDFEIQYFEIENQHKWDLGFDNNVSDGFNLISIKTKENKFHGYYLIKNAYDLKYLQDLLWNCILKNHLSYEIAKKILQPNSYKEHQELKQKLKENTANLKGLTTSD